MPQQGDKLALNEIADAFDLAHPSSRRPARTMELSEVTMWAKESGIVKVDESLHLVLTEKGEALFKKA